MEGKGPPKIYFYDYEANQRKIYNDELRTMARKLFPLLRFVRLRLENNHDEYFINVAALIARKKIDGRDVTVRWISGLPRTCENKNSVLKRLYSVRFTDTITGGIIAHSDFHPLSAVPELVKSMHKMVDAVIASPESKHDITEAKTIKKIISLLGTPA